MVKVYEAQRSHIQLLTNLGCKIVENKLHLKADRDKIKYILTSSISSKAHKLLIAEDEDGIISGAMLTATDQFSFAEKMYA